MKKRGIIITILLILVVIIGIFVFGNDSETIELKSVKSASELKQIYEGDNISDVKEFALRVLSMPFSFLTFDYYYGYDYGYSDGFIGDVAFDSVTNSSGASSSIAGSLQGSTSSSMESSSVSKDYLQLTYKLKM